MEDLVVGVGFSDREDSFTAGQIAAKQAVDQIETKPDVFIVFGSPHFEHKQLLAGIMSISGDTQMVGGTTAGEISTSGVTDQSVVVMALGSPELQFVTGIGKNMSHNELACGRALARDCRRKAEIEHTLSLLIFPNGMGGDGVKVIEGLQSVLGDYFEIVGGCLGDGNNFESTYQYYNGKVYRDSMPGLMICGSGSYKTGIGVHSGFESIGNRFYCTESNKNTVLQFDGERALDLYQEFLGEERAARLPGICLEYPFGMIDDKVSISGKEYFQLCCGLSVDHEKGTITLARAIPEGSAITLTTASRGDIINGARLAAEQAKRNLKHTKPKAILMFSCVGRKQVLGRRTQEEVDVVRKVIGEKIPLLGFYTYGEIGPIDKNQKSLAMSKFHNETVVLWVLGKNHDS